MSAMVELTNYEIDAVSGGARANAGALLVAVAAAIDKITVDVNIGDIASGNEIDVRDVIDIGDVAIGILGVAKA